jgi:hypothetical protein
MKAPVDEKTQYGQDSGSDFSSLGRDFMLIHPNVRQYL